MEIKHLTWIKYYFNVFSFDNLGVLKGHRERNLFDFYPLAYKYFPPLGANK